MIMNSIGPKDSLSQTVRQVRRKVPLVRQQDKPVCPGLTYFFSLMVIGILKDRAFDATFVWLGLNWLQQC